MQEQAMDGVRVKQEIIERSKHPDSSRPKTPSVPVSVIDLSSSDSDSDGSSSSSDGEGSANGTNGKRSRSSNGAGSGLSKKKKKKMEKSAVALPPGFLDPLPPKSAAPTLPGASPGAQASAVRNGGAESTEKVEKCKQFWKAGDYDGIGADWDTSAGGMDHLRVHPKFLHSNATSHKWVLGAFAELLDNSLDEVCNGATYVNIDMLINKKDGCKMLLIEDNGGGMDPDKMRQCMSLGYSVKSKIADTIGQYGNGFKTSTMRLGADVIVFSRCPGQNGKRSTQSIGLLSYTFLRSTGKEDIVVPTLNYERGLEWNRMIRTSTSDWDRTVETIVQWSPFSSEADLLRQFKQMKDHGTRVIIYNLWEDDQGELELDFDTDPHDIQIRGVNRDENNILKAKHYPNSKHFLTYRHSLRSYASILYLRIPPRFRIILRGKDVEHHNIVNDMMMSQEITYRPQPGADGLPKDSHLIAVVTIGFVKDAKHHIDVQGFNVYHKNRLIKPFWRVWNASGSDGRGVIGVLEANFVEPAHDKQGFERTIVLARLETKLIQMQKTYWSSLCHKIGYAPRRNKNINGREDSPDYVPTTSSHSKAKGAGSNRKTPISASDKSRPYSSPTQERRQSERVRKTSDKGHVNGHVYAEGVDRFGTPAGRSSSSRPSSPSGENISDSDLPTSIPRTRVNGNSQNFRSRNDDISITGTSVNSKSTATGQGRPVRNTAHSQLEENGVHLNGFSPSVSDSEALNKLKEENRQLKEKLARKEEEILGDLLHDLEYEKDRAKSLETKLEVATQKIEELNKEQESLIDIFSEERQRRDVEEDSLRKKLKDSSKTIQELQDKLKLLENARNNK